MTGGIEEEEEKKQPPALQRKLTNPSISEHRKTIKKEKEQVDPLEQMMMEEPPL